MLSQCGSIQQQINTSQRWALLLHSSNLRSSLRRQESRPCWGREIIFTWMVYQLHLTPFPRTVSHVLWVFNFFRNQNADNLFSPMLLCIPGWLLLPSLCRRPSSSLLCSTPDFPGALPWLLGIAGLPFPGAEEVGRKKSQAQLLIDSGLC